MNTSTPNTNRSQPIECRYALCRGVDYWALAFEGRETVFKHELGALYVAYLLGNPPREPLHGVALALHARERQGHLRGIVAATAADRPNPTIQQQVSSNQ